MAKKYKFKLDKAGVGKLLMSDEMRSVLDGYAGKVVGRAGDGYGSETVASVGRAKPGTRLKAIVRAETPKARRDNSENNTLLKALGGG